jgi:murein DD-endopeptidase MepM/ murein hydrolase activator NlpD
LIRHEGGWVTAYAHNSELLVEKGVTVKRGQLIAKAGRSGGVNQDQLHFEIRQGTKAVDPKPLLVGG